VKVTGILCCQGAAGSDRRWGICARTYRPCGLLIAAAGARAAVTGANRCPSVTRFAFNHQARGFNLSPCPLPDGSGRPSRGRFVRSMELGMQRPRLKVVRRWVNAVGLPKVLEEARPAAEQMSHVGHGQAGRTIRFLRAVHRIPISRYRQKWAAAGLAFRPIFDPRLPMAGGGGWGLSPLPPRGLRHGRVANSSHKG
jgi:hypothetical protein